MVRDFVRGNPKLPPPGYRGARGQVRGAPEGDDRTLKQDRSDPATSARGVFVVDACLAIVTAPFGTLLQSRACYF